MERQKGSNKQIKQLLSRKLLYVTLKKKINNRWRKQIFECLIFLPLKNLIQGLPWWCSG